MKSHEVLRNAIRDTGVKAISSDMNLSSSLIYKWCEPSTADSDAGAHNPLDRIAQLVKLTADTTPISWLCQQAGGFFVKNPSKNKKTDREAFKVTKQILKEFSEVLDAVTVSIEDDSYIDAKETQTIRREWEELKELGESFVVACEQGTYSKK